MSPTISTLWRVAPASVGLAAAVALSACGNGSSSPTTTTTTHVSSSNVATSLSQLEKPPSGTVALTEDGSSLLYPLYESWVSAFHKVDPHFSSTSGADGSGTGISDAESGTTVLGASDAYLPTATFKQYPTIENIPMAISAQMINYNLPGMTSTHLKLDGTVIAEMYEGKITNWDASALAKLNPGVKLPDLKVIPVHRSDSSGDSFLFTSYLADSDPGSFAGRAGPSVLPTWPNVSTALAAKGNSGMVQTCGATKGCIAYIGISYKSDTTAAHLGEAMLDNRSGHYELPTAMTIHAEAAAFSSIPSNGAISLIDGPASSGYPIINFEYIVTKTNQSSTVGAGVKAFLAWCVDPKHGNSASFLAPVNFQPLPSGALKVSLTLIKKVS